MNLETEHGGVVLSHVYVHSTPVLGSRLSAYRGEENMSVCEQR